MTDFTDEDIKMIWTYTKKYRKTEDSIDDTYKE